MVLLWGITVPAIYYAMHGKAPAYTMTETVIALTGGLVSFSAYDIVIWAMQFDAMGVVSALRETSVVSTAIIGRIFLIKKLTLRRVASCLAIVMGAG